MTRSLSQWLAYQEQLHPEDIELTLERVAEVARRLDVLTPAVPVISVAGTNGKGTAAFALEAMLKASGKRVGVYTSPHLREYNERVRIDGEHVSDVALCEAFEAVEAVRGEVALTYFEFGTLAALYLFSRDPGLDAWVLEVGLGGRLDAVNVVACDVAVITSIDLDHRDWLGDSRDEIALEKLGVSRAGRPLVIGDRNPPAALAGAVAERDGETLCIGRDFDVRDSSGGGWQFTPQGWTVPRHDGLVADNLACALQALVVIRLAPGRAAFAGAMRDLRVPGRCEVIERDGIEWILDVGHNPAALAYLAHQVATRPAVDETHVICGMLKDKLVDDVLQPLCDAVDLWHLVDLPGARGASAFDLARVLPPTCPYRVHGGVGAAVEHVCRTRGPARSRRVIVFGSFVTVGLTQI